MSLRPSFIKHPACGLSAGIYQQLPQKGLYYHLPHLFYSVKWGKYRVRPWWPYPKDDLSKPCWQDPSVLRTAWQSFQKMPSADVYKNYEENEKRFLLPLTVAEQSQAAAAALTHSRAMKGSKGKTKSSAMKQADPYHGRKPIVPISIPASSGDAPIEYMREMLDPSSRLFTANSLLESCVVAGKLPLSQYTTRGLEDSRRGLSRPWQHTGRFIPKTITGDWRGGSEEESTAGSAGHVLSMIFQTTERRKIMGSIEDADQNYCERIPGLWALCKEAEIHHSKASKFRSATSSTATPQQQFADEDSSFSFVNDVPQDSLERPNVFPYVQPGGNPIVGFNLADISRYKARDRKISIKSPVWLRRQMAKRYVFSRNKQREREHKAITRGLGTS